ncbi:MAG: hypothetical protein AAF291_16320 [Pseudomonadota bacterium]
MKNAIASLITAASLTTLGLAGTALAGQNETSSEAEQKPEIVERNDKGKATKVRVDGQVYDVCVKEDQDNCIQPREIGLDFGNRPLDYWPGKPASEM